MPAVLPSKLFSMSKATDPKKAVIDAVGTAIDQIHVRNNLILVGTYVSPEVLRKGKRNDGSTFEILRADNNKSEDLWMGCMGLVLKKGPQAFKDDERLNIYWDGQDVQEGQWVLFRFSDGWETHLNGTSVRLIEDRAVKAVIDNPDIIVSKPSVVVE